MSAMQEITEFCTSVKLIAMYALYVVSAAAIVFVAALWLFSSVAVAVTAGVAVALSGMFLGWYLRDVFPVAASLGG